VIINIKSSNILYLISMKNLTFTGLSNKARIDHRAGTIDVVTNPNLVVISKLANVTPATILAYLNPSDMTSLREYIFVDTAGTVLGLYPKEATLAAFDSTIGTDAAASYVLSNFTVTRSAGSGGGGVELDPIYNSEKGQPLGVPTLDATGKILPSFLPTSTSTDDVLEFATRSAFPAAGAVGKVYIDLALDTAYVWDTTTNDYKSLGGAVTGATISNFSPTTAYTTGQLVISGNKIYQAIGATPAGTFNATQWTEISPSAASASVITTQTVTGTGTLTQAQETALVAGFNKNTTTGEVWFKDAAGIVTKLEKQGSAMCISSALTPIAANGTFTYNHALNDLEPLVQVINATGNVVTSSVNITTKIVDANNVSVTIGSVAGSYKVKVCTGSFTTLNVTGGGATTNAIAYVPATGVLTSTVNNISANVTIPPVTLDGNDKHIVRTNATVNVSPTATEVPTPIAGDTAKVQLSDGTIEFYSFGTAWVKDFTSTSGGYSQDITLEYGTGSATVGTSFESADNGGVSTVLLPTTVTTAKIDPTQVKIRINKGTSPASACNVKIRKNTSTTDCITYTIPANSTVGAVITPVVAAGVTFVNGDILTCNLSVDCPFLDFGTYFVLIKA
jgi:hypothetical protein